ncbi:MAG TPA: mechanosensitive ion channel protein MscS [Flavobacteriales bacterium]|jgi:miniconductance mechanosensitive channel|nr:mechanosensitive ion channel protein MscS [Flavobacteriales bacterium]
MNDRALKLSTWIAQQLENSGLGEQSASFVSDSILFIVLIIAAWILYRTVLFALRRILIPIFQRSKNQFDDLLIKYKFFRRLSYLAPAVLIYYMVDETLAHYPFLVSSILKGLEVYFIVLSVIIIDSILSTINDYYNRYEFAKDHPIRGLIQVVKIIIYVFGFLIVLATLIQRDVSSLFISLGTLSAVLMLIFRDPILGFVGGLQLIFNRMLSIGDWISMPKFGADGVVLEINLTTVKVQNWDKTIVTIPTYSLISDSFQNWRGMEESGGRRIKRSIILDMDSIKFCTPDMLEEFKKYEVLKEYLFKKEEELNNWNSKHNIDSTILVNGRRQTNVGVFRAYLEAYLHRRSDLRKDMTFMVRQLEPTDKGLPIQIYVFTKTTAWIEYEGIQADIFDHILSVIPHFGLRTFQFPSGRSLDSVFRQDHRASTS